MRNQDTGALPVVTNHQLAGMITDRDITVRAVAAGRMDATVGDILSPGTYYCFEDDSVERAANVMAEHQVRRLPVVNRDMQLVGIVSLGDMSQRDDDSAGLALADVSEKNDAPRQ